MVCEYFIRESPCETKSNLAQIYPCVNLEIHGIAKDEAWYSICFEITGSDDPFYSVKNQTRLKAGIEQLESGKGIPHDLIEVGNG